MNNPSAPSSPAFRIPLFRVAAQNQRIRAEIMDAMARVMESGMYVLGTECRSFEAEFSAYCGAEFGVGVNSGTDALILGLRALEMPVGAEVIVPSLTFPATVMATIAAGCVPVFADVDDTLTLDSEDVARVISSRTKAIIAVHWAGLIGDMARLRQLCDADDISLVEDAAQAHGARSSNRRAGAIGTLACFSFHPTKNLASIGDGGMITTSNADIAERVRLLRNLGRTGRETYERIGCNSRLDELQAAVLRVKLHHLDATNRERTRVCERYTRELAATTVKPPVVPSQRTHAYHLYIVRTTQRDALRAALASLGIEAAPHYATPCHRLPIFHEYTSRPLPHTDRLCQQILSLPVCVTHDEQQCIISELSRW